MCYAAAVCKPAWKCTHSWWTVAHTDLTVVRCGAVCLALAFGWWSVLLQVGIHELLGHGSGKLYEAGTLDAEALVAAGTKHPLTGQPITGPFYAPG